MLQPVTPDTREVGLRVGQQLVDVGALVQPSPDAGVRLQNDPHLQERAAHVLQGGHREVTLRPVDRRVREYTARDRLQRVLPPSLSFSTGGILAASSTSSWSEEGHPHFQAPGHRHVFDALDRIVDDQGGGVEAQDLVGGFR